MQSPRHYLWEQTHREEQPDNKNFIFGSYVHAALLEPDTLKDSFVVIDMKTRHNKEYYAAAAIARKTGKQIILSGEKRDAEYIVENAQNDPHVMDLLNNSFAEVSAAAKIGDVWLKARMDGYIPERKLMLDIKTTGESIYWFESNVRRWAYDISAPIYMDVVNAAAEALGDPNHGAETYLFLVIEKAPPFGIKIFEMTPEYLADGRTRYLAVLPAFKECLDTGIYSGYDNSSWTKLFPRNKLDSLSPNEKVPEEV
jgi:hypothetical protein